MKRILTLFVLAIAALSCRPEEVDPVFILDSDVKLMMGETTLLKYNPQDSQISFDKNHIQFAIVSDDASQFCTIQMTEVPSQVGQTISGSILWATDDHGIDMKSNVALQVVKTEGDKVWLWNSNGGIKAVIRVLE